MKLTEITKEQKFQALKVLTYPFLYDNLGSARRMEAIGKRDHTVHSKVIVILEFLNYYVIRVS